MRIKPGLLLPPPPVPEYVVGAHYVFNYKGYLYPYMAYHNHLSYHYGRNNTILVAVFGTNYKTKLERIYGYTPDDGVWPVWRSYDKTAGQRVFKALVERGVEITLI